MKVTTVIYPDDVIYDPIRDKLMVVHNFGTDAFGQLVVYFSTAKDLRKKEDYTQLEALTSKIVFKYFEKVGEL